MQFWKVFLCSYQSTQRPQPGLSFEYVQIDPIDIEGFCRLSIRFDQILFVNQATPRAVAHYCFLSDGDGVSRH
jgi:hypothetical protein